MSKIFLFGLLFDYDWIIYLILAIIVGLYFWRTRAQVTDGIITGLVDLGMNKAHFTGLKARGKTPSGCPIFSTVDVPVNAQKNFEIGIQNQLNYYSKLYPGWTKKNKISDYALVVVNPSGTSVETLPGAPTINVRGQQASGTVIGLQANTGPDREYIVMPHQAATAWKFYDYWMVTSRNESVHVRMAYNDLNEFAKHLGEADVHFEFEGIKQTPAIPV